MTTPIKLGISIDHPAFAGHFPNSPIVPGVVLLDFALHAIATAEGFILNLYELNSVKFLNPITQANYFSPLTQNTAGSENESIVVTVDYMYTNKDTLDFDIISGTCKIAKASVTIGNVIGLT
jgi:hypothetical protein